ncbi:flagellar L-ring protein precursor FlgH [Sphingopyxis panaciterrae]|uniref:flagellar basal body L-ring protein FlgH n=1 Tax=Sphingopyxis panaciterrae TaxID=363841 RepID=UPI00141F30B4|nr:flagellar basal body L-ring protein FlgH [Sphingopyxis panaciterrae]NIJ36970.1 flagellar L-ring protein precursor FlgH [Sphingopyxis panaciterrae]
MRAERRWRSGAVLAAMSLLLAAMPGAAEDLYKGGGFPAIASDIKAAGVGDAVTIVIFENASASNRVTNRSSKKTQVQGGLSAGSIDEHGSLDFGGGFTGTGEVSRSEQLVARITAQVTGMATNGDMMIEGQHNMLINGENRNIRIRGRIRPVDIMSDNSVVSSRIADAQISFDGKGFVSRSAKPGLLNRIFGFLGIG